MIELARSPEQIGNIIRRARKKSGMSQSELGKRSGLRQETISLIESGNPATKLETILAVTSALGLEFQISPRVSQGLIGLPSGGIQSLRATKGEHGVSPGLLGTKTDEPE